MNEGKLYPSRPTTSIHPHACQVLKRISGGYFFLNNPHRLFIALASGHGLKYPAAKMPIMSLKIPTGKKIREYRAHHP